MSTTPVMAFEPASVSIALDDLLPVRRVSAAARSGRKFRQIAASVREIGIAQPPVVARHGTLAGKYLLLDGHFRVEVLKELGIDRVTCLVSTDDEAFTYNRQVNRLATVQEHRMILKLVERGVPEARIAKTLDVNINSIRRKRDLLQGICPEAADLLQDRQCPLNSFRQLRKLKAVRQVEVAELMIAMNNYSVPYATALVEATPPDLLVGDHKTRPGDTVSRRQIERMEREMASLQRGIKRVEGTFGPDHLHLVLAVGYLRSLLGNPAITRYLERHHREIRLEFQSILDATALSAQADE